MDGITIGQSLLREPDSLQEMVNNSFDNVNTEENKIAGTTSYSISCFSNKRPFIQIKSEVSDVKPCRMLNVKADDGNFHDKTKTVYSRSNDCTTGSKILSVQGDQSSDEESLDEGTVITDEMVYCSDKEQDNNFETAIDDESLNSTRSNVSLSEGESLSCVTSSKRKYNEKDNLVRKRLRRPDLWERNITKNATNLGLEYFGSNTKKPVPARVMKRGCGPGCRYKCETKISEEQRQCLFKDYWNIKTQSEKYNYILRFVKEESKKSNQKQVTTKKFSRTYSFNINGVNVTVCSLMFLDTLSISRQVVETALKKVRNGDISPVDNRGSSEKSRRTVDKKKLESVLEHINMFQRVESHYNRKESRKEYLEEGLSISKMYQMYVQWAKENCKDIATKHYYSDVFNTQFNIGFFRPKKDSCDICEGFKNATDEDKSKLKANHEAHLRNKIKAREEKIADAIVAKQDKGNNVSMICFDFEKILTTPKTEASCLYYKRKLSVYNFTIYDVSLHKGFCYVWSENEAKKGSNEVASCLLHYIQQRASEGIIEFLLYSDNCVGQNKNKNVFSMLVYASSKYNVNIKYTFLETGHTQNEGDSVHALIERHSSGRNIYTVNEWYDIIRSAKQTFPHYEVIEVTHSMIYDFKDLANNTNWQKTVIKKNKKKFIPIGTSQFKQILISRESPNELKYKTSFENVYEKLILRKEKNHTNVTKYVLKQAYDSIQGISKQKSKDLLDLCKKNIIPPEYHEYYKSFSIKIFDETDAEYN